MFRGLRCSECIGDHDQGFNRRLHNIEVKRGSYVVPDPGFIDMVMLVPRYETGLG